MSAFFAQDQIQNKIYHPGQEAKTVLSNKTVAFMAAGILFGVNYKVLGTSKNFQKNTLLLNLVKIRLRMESPTAKLMCMRHLLPNSGLIFDLVK